MKRAFRVRELMDKPERVASVLTLLLLIAAILPQTIGAQESTAVGKQLFEKRCTGCHELDRNKVGPRLAGVYGRQAGTAPNFNYSPSLKAAGFVWDEQRLNQWLTDTQSVVEDNNMDFHVPKADERTEIIRYLKELTLLQRAASTPQTQK
jgi:cytochrome c